MNTISNFSTDKPLLVLDFDGTVALGDGPIYAYARAVAKYLDSSDRDRLLDTLDEFLAGTLESASELVFKDGYDAVAKLSEHAVTRDQRNAAYFASREAVARGEVGVHAPERLADFLAEMGQHVHRLLFTNAPLTGVAESLDSLGLTGLIDSIVPNAGKPEGFASKLPELLAGRAPERLLSVGDVWLNDIKHPLDAGCATAFIDRFGLNSGPAHLSAPAIEDLYTGMADWARNPAAFHAAHSVTDSTV